MGSQAVKFVPKQPIISKNLPLTRSAYHHPTTGSLKTLYRHKRWQPTPVPNI
ncbi:hypothetical protein DSO57_1001609 [Entomophthora muscae]|uniref:Uncharacterized protein n=1 Tax=Entomophthora muscae TaxID=34485 RepID=A0ACC2RZZ5_9FUNG|nr:hypothetical protein DSO57_1001609 [Entomophthora muscae]